jgi:hypothetical protein
VGQPLPCATIVFRSVFPAQLEGGEVGLTAFHLPGRDEGELSTWLNSDAAWSRLSRVRRVLSLHVGRIRTLELEVVDDPLDPEHALILNLPPPHVSDEAFQEANRIAGLLLDISRAVEQQSQ